MKEPITLMLVEDSPAYREVITLAVERDTQLQLNNAYGTAEEALRALQEAPVRQRPHLVLLDLHLPSMNGLEALPWIKQYAPEVKVIILTQSSLEADVLKAISQGAKGYLLKSATMSQIKEGIRSVWEGNALLDGSLAGFLAQALASKPSEIPLEKPLSDRELEILTLLGDGLVKKEIAEHLGIGFATVATHIRRIYEKLQVENAPAAIAKAFKSGVLK